MARTPFGAARTSFDVRPKAAATPRARPALRPCFTLSMGILAALPLLATAQAVDLLELSIEELGNVVVAGTRIPRTDVAAPMIIVTREEFENAGFESLEDLFASLPENFDEVTPDGRFANEGGSILRGLNNSRITAVDLRGLGAQSTLTLVNGMRRAGSIEGRVVDIATIPLSIIERVEVVTGGRSAVYGADAVAGVVNLVTRRDFEGSESQLRVGASADGGERLQLAHLVGIDRERGRFVAAYDFARTWPLDLADAGFLSLTPNPEIGLTQLSLNARAEARRHSVYASGRRELNERTEVYGEALYTDKKFDDLERRRFAGATEESFTEITNPAEHVAVTGGLRRAVGAGWTLNAAIDRSRAANTRSGLVFADLGFTSITSQFRSDDWAILSSLSVVGDGPLPSIGGIEPRAAAGVEWRQEEFRNAANGVTDIDADRRLSSAFVELSFPLLGGSEADERSLELSVAGRYDDYNDVGDTFNPQAGLIWSPAEGVTLRAAYTTSFRAPALVELQSTAQAFLELASDPEQGGAPVPVLFVQGRRPDLGPEEAETWSLGIDFQPRFAQWAELSFSYFEVEYDGRIEQPSINADRELVLERAIRFPGLIALAPTAAQAQAFIDIDADGVIDNDTGTPFDSASGDILEVFPNLVLFDNRTGNIAIEEISGLSFTIGGELESRAGVWTFGLDLTRTFDHDRSVTASSPAFSLLDEVGKPAATRARVNGGWTRNGWSAFLFLNFVDDYHNPFSTPASEIGSWTTVDVSLRMDGPAFGDAAFLQGLEGSVSVRNLFADEPPRFVGSLQGVLYDTTKADPFGRYLSLNLVKRW